MKRILLEDLRKEYAQVLKGHKVGIIKANPGLFYNGKQITSIEFCRNGIVEFMHRQFNDSTGMSVEIIGRFRGEAYFD